MILCGYTTVGKGEGGGAGAVRPPPPGGNWVTGREGWIGLRRIGYVTINDGA